MSRSIVIPEPSFPQIFDLAGKLRYPESRAVRSGLPVLDSGSLTFLTKSNPGLHRDMDLEESRVRNDAIIRRT